MADTSKFKVLIVEDDHDLRDAYLGLLRVDPTLEFRLTHDGGHAAAMLRTEPFDVAILDIRLPSMNGLQVADIARSSTYNRTMPIVVVSGALNTESLARAKAFAGVKIIEKPVSSDDLLDAVADALRPLRRADGYSARVINAILAATRHVLESAFGAPVLLNKPSFRKGPGTKSGTMAAATMTGEAFAGSLALLAPELFVAALAARAPSANAGPLTPERQSAIACDVLGRICGRLNGTFAALAIKSSAGLPAGVPAGTYPHTPESPVMFVILGVAGTDCEMEFCLTARSGVDVSESTEISDPAAAGILVFE